MTALPEDTASLEERLRQGDREALAVLFMRFRDRLARIVQFRLGEPLRTRVDPDDLLQDAYLAAEKRIKHFADDSFKSAFLWFRLIVNQTLVDVYRHHLGVKARDPRLESPINRKSRFQDTSVSIALQLVSPDTSPSQVVSRQELFAKIEKIIAAMDPIDQEILALRHFEELTNSEAASVLGLKDKTASQRYMRALVRLKTELAKFPGFFPELVHE